MHTQQKLLLELLWWMTTIALAFLILAPVWNANPNYPFWTTNLLFIFLFVTATRYTFFLHLTWLAHLRWIKVVLFFLAIPLVFFLIQEINGFQVFLDEQGVDAIVGTLPLERQASMMTYIRNELLFFGVGAVVACVALPLRLLISVWRIFNQSGI